MIQKSKLLLITLISLNASQAIAIAGSPKRIVLAWENSPRSIDPRYAVDADSQYLVDLLHCSLIAFDKNGSTVPSLAKKWAWTGGTNLEIELKPKATFSDGTPVKPDDVKATYEYFLKGDLATPSPLAGAFKNVKSISTKENKVVFTLIEPDATFITNLMIGILPKKLVKNEVLSFSSNITGCGPFILESMNVNGLLLKKNQKYNLDSPAHINEVEIKIVKDETTRFAKLRKGEVDLIQNIVSRDKIAKIKNYPNLRIQRKPGLKTTYLGFNIQDKFLKNIKVRRAISMAINREAIIKYLLNGLAIPATTMLTPSDPFLNTNVKTVSYDTKTANKLLDEAGFKLKAGKKQRFTLTYKTTQNTTRVGIAKAIASDLGKIGIHVIVQPLEWGRFKADVEAGHVQLWSLAWVGFKDPDIYRYAFATESFAPNGGNRGRYSNPAVDKLLKAGKLATDFKERKKTYDEIQSIVAQELPYVFLWHEENFAVMNNSIKGFEVYADGRFSSLKQISKK
ncbi:MAG: ABC transporter substrate-binding protein [Bdellovibrionota bacterium]